MYICDNMYMYIHGTNTISDTERGKGVAPGYRQLSRQRVKRGGGFPVVHAIEISGKALPTERL